MAAAILNCVKSFIWSEERKSHQNLLAELFLHYFLPSFNAFLITAITLATAHLRMGQGLHLAWCYFFPTQIILNWVQFVRNRSIVPISPESFPGVNSKLTFNNRISFQINNKEYRYKACYPCGIFVPLRSHHCPYCRKCIYVLDHHCFFLGYCVGRQNMKYFVMFCVYAAFGTAYGLYHIMDTMTYYRDISGTEAMYFFFPFIIVMYIIEKAAGFEVYYVFLLDFGLGALIITIFLATMGLYSTLNGTTPYEEKRNIKVQNKRDVVANFKLAFGQYGLLHLIVPVMPFPEARLEHGYVMDLSYNQYRRRVYSIDENAVERTQYRNGTEQYGQEVSNDQQHYGQQYRNGGLHHGQEYMNGGLQYGPGYSNGCLQYGQDYSNGSLQYGQDKHNSSSEIIGKQQHFNNQHHYVNEQLVEYSQTY